ncbi:MAG: response regulator [Planctomycetota bacterium]|nr:response regulator [Planctomycetota bacterium]MDA1140866.1 response regulator [Planctomycetota bacterium]
MSKQQLCRPIEILMIEDNPGDVRLAQEGLKRGKVVNNLRVAEDGETGLAMLRKEGEHAGSASPDLILLDLNLPGMGGREVLAEIKSDPALEHIPVVVLTSSEAEEDILKSYKLKANSYIIKPVEFQKFMDMMKKLDDYWLAFVKLPPNGDL